jgi:hypothetical protein
LAGVDEEYKLLDDVDEQASCAWVGGALFGLFGLIYPLDEMLNFLL